MITDLSPAGVESVTGGGTLSILVFDALGAPVPQATVTIVSSDVSPAVNLIAQTNDNGLVFLPGALACSGCYEVSITKSGFSSDKTYSTAEIANPTNPHATVIVGELTELLFSIDRTSTVNFVTQNYDAGSFTPLANQELLIQGNKTLGTNAFDEPVYKYEDTITTDANGSATLEGVEWGVYEITLPSEVDRNIAVATPLLPFTVDPNTTPTAQIGLAANNNPGLTVIITDSADAPIPLATAVLSNGVDYEETLETGESTEADFGQVYFTDIVPADYTLTLTATGYLDDIRTVTISGHTTETVILNQP